MSVTFLQIRKNKYVTLKELSVNHLNHPVWYSSASRTPYGGRALGGAPGGAEKGKPSSTAQLLINDVMGGRTTLPHNLIVI